jgi:poly(A) polymerase
MPIRYKIDKAAVWILEKLAESGFEAYLVGGAVRDLLQDIEPKDYDIATSAHPEEVRKVFGRRQSRIIGRRFRLAHVYVNGTCFEVSTFRRQPSVEERKGRAGDDGTVLWRDNEYGTLEDDAWRRDFSVNSLYYDVVGGRGIVDYVGGVEDLQNKVVRILGDPRERLEEDPVRILRALKLVAQYDFKLEPALQEVLCGMVERIELSSRARLFEELLKILGRSYSHSTFVVGQRYGFLEHFWPNLAQIWDDEEGVLVQDALRERDRRIKAGGYTTSKTLALATACVFPVMAKMNPDGKPGELWDPAEVEERACRDLLNDFFLPFPVPRVLSARARDLIMMLPRFVQKRQPRKLQHHPEYKYARELFLLVATVCGWSQELQDFWPVPEPNEHVDAEMRRKSARRGRRSRGGRRRRRHHKEEGDVKKP